MAIKRGTADEAAAIMELVECARRHLRESGILQWDQHYPNREVIESDLEKGCLFIWMEEDSHAGIVVLNEEQDLEYSAIPWEDSDGRMLCLHRLIVHPGQQGKGFGKSLLQFAEQQARDGGYTSIRLDAYSGNPVALRLYEQHGYHKRGEVYFPRRELPFLCYEKMVSSRS
ncbi:GNAT family N-acetyltransferase [Gorillibacterium sp. CAU 1737]|uniref:GNAT family N-acetyltransferase n=1 Tax=Gorillibacterium sp. CAU 1737 TaxID=3140362 RepID=UPI0032613CD5